MDTENKDAKNERYVWVKKMAKGLPDDWMHDISRDRLHDKVIAEIMEALSPFTDSDKLKEIKKAPSIYIDWFNFINLSRNKEWTKVMSDHLIVSLFMGTDTESGTMFFPEINQEIIDFVYKKTWDIERWNAECKDYGCDPSRPGHKYLAFAIALQGWYTKLYRKAVYEAFF